VNVYGNGASAVIISLDQKPYPVSVKLHFECTNNTTEYEACILGLEVALELKIRKMDVYGDLMLIICQVKGEWQTKKEKLRSYQEYLSTIGRIQRDKIHPSRKRREPFCGCFGHVSCYGYD